MQLAYHLATSRPTDDLPPIVNATATGPSVASLWIVSAPSGGGKTSLTRALVPELARRGLPATISVSYTTRAPRPGEQDGVHYHFVSPEQFDAMAARGDFLEHADVFGRKYGTGKAKTLALLAEGTDVILDIDWQGGRQVRKASTGAAGIFILPPSAGELERRLRGRGQDGDAVIADRMRAARSEMSHFAEYEYVVVNQDFDTALAEMTAIFIARRLELGHQQARYAGLIGELLE